MNEVYFRENINDGCYFHPNEVVIGVCHLCLNERLLILAAKQGLKSSKSSTSNSTLYQSKPSVSLPRKILTLRSFFHRRDIDCHRKFDRDFIDFVDDPSSTSTSFEDESFISIKFGDNGVASWDKSSSNAVSKVRLENCSMKWGGQTLVKHRGSCSSGSILTDNNNSSKRSVVEHAKPRAQLMWRNRIGQMLQVIRWKRSSKAKANGSMTAGSGNTSMNKGSEAVKVVRSNKGWIKPLKIRTKV